MRRLARRSGGARPSRFPDTTVAICCAFAKDTPRAYAHRLGDSWIAPTGEGEYCIRTR